MTTRAETKLRSSPKKILTKRNNKMNNLGNIGILLIGIAMIVMSITGAIEVHMIYDLDYSEAAYIDGQLDSNVPVY